MWPRKRGRGNSEDDEILHMPNFVADGNRLADILDAKFGNVDEEATSHSTREHIISELIDRRINSLSGLFRPLLHPLRDQRTNTRAADLSDKQLTDWVLKGACSETFLRPKKGKEETEQQMEAHAACQTDKNSPDTNHNRKVMKQIAEGYHSQREERRRMAKEYASRRHMHRGLEIDTTAQNDTVRIDQHGRLVHATGSLNGGEGRQNEDNTDQNNNSNDQADELEDASETFWRQYSLSEAPQHRYDFAGNNLRNNILPAAIQPAPPIVNERMRRRDISQQMERDARGAIERALERYRQQEAIENAGQLRYDLINIPLVTDTRRENNDPPRSSLFRRNNRDQRQARDGNEGEDQIGQDGNAREQQNRQVRLAFRRICYAVITVTAAFVCIMIQGAMPVDFRDDTRLEVDDFWLSGLMGEHSQMHPIISRAARVATKDHFPEEEDDEGDEDPSPFAMLAMLGSKKFKSRSRGARDLSNNLPEDRVGDNELLGSCQT